MLGSRTKKVNTYGKKRVGVINLFSDDKTWSPVRHDPSSTTSTTDKLDGPPASPVPQQQQQRRAPLTNKLSSDANTTVSPVKQAEKRSMSKAKSTITATAKAKHLAGEEGFFADNDEKKVNCTKPSTSKTLKAKPKSNTAIPANIKQPSKTKKQYFDCVEIPFTPRSRVVTNIEVEVAVDTVIETLSSTSITIPPEPDYAGDYARLLAASTITHEHDFTAFLSSPAVQALLDPAPAPASSSSKGKKTVPAFRKIGEASYSEVFALRIRDGKDIMVKVIPLFDHSSSLPRTQEGDSDGAKGQDLPDTSYPGDVLRELEITTRMCELPGGGFIDYLGSYITKGKYPEVLVDQWWDFKTSLGSASICPERFGEEQRYALIVLSDGGIDLETFKFDPAHGWRQAAGVFWQTVDALARAEAWARFEHRDLHEGQILIAPTDIDFTPSTTAANYLSSSFTGAQATIIDFGLSRLDLPGTEGATWSAFPPEVYEGKGEQWDVYRSMRDTIGDDWAGFHTETNVLWSRYIVRYLLHRTASLRKPKLPTAHAQRSRRTRAPRKSDITDQAVLDAYVCLQRTEEMLSSAEHGLQSAADLMAWGRSQVWVA